MSGGPIGDLNRANAVAMMIDGKLLLRKFQLQPIGGEAVLTGAVLLSAGASDTGRVPLGARLDETAPNFVGAFAKGTTTLASVTLEVGFAEQRGSDQIGKRGTENHRERAWRESRPRFLAAPHLHTDPQLARFCLDWV